MIYTHVLNRGLRGVQSPLDRDYAGQHKTSCISGNDSEANVNEAMEDRYTEQSKHC